MARQSYTDEQKQAALEMYEEQGPSAVQREMGIPKSTVQSWAKAAGVRTVRNERTGAATEAARMRWEQRRAGLADLLGEVAQTLAGRMVDIPPKDARSLAGPVGVCIEKAELLSGRPTQRDERVKHSEFEDEVARLRAEVEAKRSKAKA